VSPAISKPATASHADIPSSRLLDLLLDVNNCPQIPPDKRIDLSLDPPASEEELSLPIDHAAKSSATKNGTKSYKQLLAEVPHFGFASAAGRLQEMAINDLNTGRDSPADPQQGAPHPPTFLTADDLDNYIYGADVRVAAHKRPETPTDFLPTLAPIAGTHGQPPDKSIPPSALLESLENASAAHSFHNPSNPATSASAARDSAVRNPASVYNWLRKHAPKTFLQDHEVSAADHHAASEETPHAKGAKGSRGGGDKGDRSSKPSARGHKKPPGSRPSKVKDLVVDPMDLDDEHDHLLTPSEKKPAPKRKRVVDDDPGYRPKGGSSRPKAKKRKSVGGGAGDETPSAAPPPAKKARKSVPAKAERHETEEEEEEEVEAEAITARGHEEEEEE